MTSRIITLLLLTIATSNAFAQEKESNAHIGLVYPISTNGTDAANYNNKFSLHLIGGVSSSERAFCASGLANIIKKNGNGLVASGFTNVILQNAKGVQASGFVNYIRKDAKGVQAAGYVNVTGSGTGLQTAGFVNVNLKNYRGVQDAGFVNVTGSGTGLQAAGFTNVTLKNYTGVQVAGFANVSKKITGFQGAGFVNVAKKARGVQAAGFVNAAKKVKGTQLAGFVNVSGDVHSQAAGFINVAKKVKGVQLSGFINIADSSDFPIGLVNISRKGEKCVGVTVDDNATTMLTFRSGGKYLYGIVGVGANFRYNDAIYGLEAGLGGHIPLAKSFRINTEVAITALSDFYDQVQLSTSFRILPAVKLGNRVELFAGPTLTYEYSEYDYLLFNRRTGGLWSNDQRGHWERLYIGGLAGIQLHI